MKPWRPAAFPVAGMPSAGLEGMHPSEPAMNTMNAFQSNLQNVTPQRWLAMAGGVAALALGMRRSPVLRIVLGTAAGGLLYRGLTGRNPLVALTPLLQRAGGRTEHLYAVGSVVIARSAQDLYEFWRNFENLPSFMRHLEAVQVLDPLHSHWRVKAPAGTAVEWDAEVIRDIPGQEIAWRALPGSDIENWGSVRFRQVIDGSGTEVQVRLNYRPPAGKLGAMLAALFGEEPQQQLEDDLDSLKQLLEAGTLPTGTRPTASPAQVVGTAGGASTAATTGANAGTHAATPHASTASAGMAQSPGRVAPRR